MFSLFIGKAHTCQKEEMVDNMMGENVVKRETKTKRPNNDPCKFSYNAIEIDREEMHGRMRSKLNKKLISF